MSKYEGFCLKCKIYGLIKDPKIFTMSNGRKRAQGLVQKMDAMEKFQKSLDELNRF